MSAELSVIIPSFNTGSYIAEAVLSVVQDVPDAEIIVVDDASTDNTIKNLESLKLQNLKVIVLPENSPGGAGHPSNVGIDAATGEYIAFVDSDDFFYPGYLSRMVKKIKSSDADICVSSYSMVDAISHVESPAYDSAMWRTMLKKTFFGRLPKEYYFRLSPEPWRKVYHSRILKDERIRLPVNGWFNEDYPFHWLCGLFAEKGIVYVNNEDYLHRLSRIGQTTAALDKRIFFLFDHTDVILKFINQNESLAVYNAYLLNWLLVGGWKLRRLSENIDEYYERYRALILSFDEEAVKRLRQFCLPEHLNIYDAIQDAGQVSSFLTAMRWQNAEV